MSITKTSNEFINDIQSRISFANKYIESLKGLRSTSAEEFKKSLLVIINRTKEIHQAKLHNLLDGDNVGEQADMVLANVKAIRAAIKTYDDLIDIMEKADSYLDDAYAMKKSLTEKLSKIKESQEVMNGPESE